MNWEKAKNVLIIFFLIINVCLSAILINMRHADTTLSEENVRSTIALLEKNNIKISDEEIIPKKKFRNRNFNLVALFSDSHDILKNWLGEEYKLEEEDSSKYYYCYRNQNKKLSINKTNISFTVDKNAVLMSEKSEKEMTEFLQSKLKKLNFDKNDYYFKKVWFENGLYHGIISSLAENTKIAGIEMKITADKDEIINALGKWFVYVEKETFADDGLLDITSVLASVIFLDEYENTEILEITYAGYVADEYLENKEVTAVPVYIITCNNGRSYYFDARSGSLLVYRQV